MKTRYDLYAIDADSETLTDTPIYSITFVPHPRRSEKQIYLEEHYGMPICREAVFDHLFIVDSTAWESVGRGP